MRALGDLPNGECLDSVKRVGAQGHVMDDVTFEAARDMFHEDVVSAAEDVVRRRGGLHGYNSVNCKRAPRRASSTPWSTP